MYVDPFWAGVLTTICTEILFLFVLAVIGTVRRMKK